MERRRIGNPLGSVLARARRFAVWKSIWLVGY